MVGGTQPVWSTLLFRNTPIKNINCNVPHILRSMKNIGIA